MTSNRSNSRNVGYYSEVWGVGNHPFAQFEEGLNERLTAIKAPQIIDLLDDPLLTKQLDWNPAWFPPESVCSDTYAYTAELLLDRLNEKEVNVLRAAKPTAEWGRYLAEAGERVYLDGTQILAIFIWLFSSLGPVDPTQMKEAFFGMSKNNATERQVISDNIDLLVVELSALKDSRKDGYGWHLIAKWIEKAEAEHQPRQRIPLPLPSIG
jgi:hypothetical protein